MFSYDECVFIVFNLLDFFVYVRRKRKLEFKCTKKKQKQLRKKESNR